MRDAYQRQSEAATPKNPYTSETRDAYSPETDLSRGYDQAQGNENSVERQYDRNEQSSVERREKERDTFRDDRDTIDRKYDT